MDEPGSIMERIARALERLAPARARAADFGAARLFRHDPASGGFVPAPDFALDLDLLVGVERQKLRFTENLARFATGLPERFVVLCDDLSFEEGAAAAKALKSALEGGVSGPPANVLFVATSNRRHLMPRDHVESRGAIAAAEDAEEEVSVSDRFGLWIGFPPMDQDAFLAAVRAYAVRFDLIVPDLDRRALQWSQLRGARSGRVAWQFVRDIAGELGKPLPL